MTTTNQSSLNNENQQKSTNRSGNNQQNNQVVTLKTKIQDTISTSNNNENNNSSPNWIKLQSLKLRKFELEQLLNEKNKLLQQIQNQEAEIVAGNTIIDKLNSYGNGNINCNNSTTLRRNNENNSFRDRKCLYSSTSEPIKSSSLNNFDLFAMKDDTNDIVNKSDLLSVSSFNSENSKSKTKEKLWFDSSLDGPIIQVDTTNLSNNSITSTIFPKTINETHSFCHQQRPSSPHHIVNSQIPSIYQQSKFNSSNASILSHNSNQYNRNNHLHYITEVNNTNGVKLTNNNDSFLVYHDQSNQFPLNGNGMLVNSSNGISNCGNVSSTSSGGGGACGGNTSNYYNRHKNHRDRLKLSSQSMSSGSNNYYKMQVIKLEDLSYLSLSTSVLNGNVALDDENISSSTTKLNRLQTKKLPIKCHIPNTIEINLQNSHQNDCSPIQNLQNVCNIIQDSGLPPVPQIVNNNDNNNNNSRWKSKVYDNLYKNSINNNKKNSSNFNERFLVENKSSTLPVYNNSEISFSKPLSPPPRNVILDNYVLSTIPSSTYQCNINGKETINNYSSANNSNNLKNTKYYYSHTKNHQIISIPLTNTLPQTTSQLLASTSTTPTVLSQNKSTLSKSPDLRMESPKNVTVVQQATFMPYKEVSKPFEMSDFYKYSTKFRQKESPITSGSINNNNYCEKPSNNNNEIVRGNLNSNINMNPKLLSPLQIRDNNIS